LVAGSFAGVLCKRWGASLLVGYLLVGAVIGGGVLQLVAEPRHELEMIAEAGALFLLFSVGLEFSIDELAKLKRYFLAGGLVQMALVSAPLTLAAWAFGLPIRGAVLAGLAGSLSSTVLVFRALTEFGQTETPHGRRGIAILLFQDVALVPILLLTPLLLGTEAAPRTIDVVVLLVKSVGFVAGLGLVHYILNRYYIPALVLMRSVELVVLLAITILVLFCWVAYRLGLPPAIGAFAAGIALSGNRLSKQIDSIVLPFRETFAAVFFVSLGMLLRPTTFFAEPFLLLAGLLAMLVLKAAAGAIALRMTGLSWRAALGMGLGLAQLGEFSFLLVSRGVSNQIIDAENYNRMLFIAVSTLILTPWLLRVGMQLTRTETESLAFTTPTPPQLSTLIIGIGPIGGQLASRLETVGIDVGMLDLSPVNLHPYAQLGFTTYTGDARDPAVLLRADIERRQLVVVCVPLDELALEILRLIRQVAPHVEVIVRCRYQSSTSKLRRAGASEVVSEEQEAAGPLLHQCESWIERHRSPN
jgi:monovalent cation:H+ antiporter-2, CPA2 family